jgi:two-component sensor histidine kinase
MFSETFRTKPYLKFALAAAAVWTAGAALSLSWNLSNTYRTVELAARTAARTAYEKDMVYRAWSSQHGGVYVPVSDYATPNPFLDGLDARDVTTDDGRLLTLLNPSYMTRQVHEMEQEKTGVRGHLTSLDPIRPGNAPDNWERKALRSILAGEEEYSGVDSIDGLRYMRLMKPVAAEESCLKCHEQHGYEIGDLRGGLSVGIPMEPFTASAVVSIRAIWFWHIFTWTLGIAGIIFSANRLNDYYRSHEKAEAKIRDSLREKEVLLREIHHRVKNNLQVISGMLELQATTVADREARITLREGRNRVMTMSLIHQKLYQSEDIAHIAMDSYLKGLSADLFSSYGVDSTRISLSVRVDPVHLGLDMAIPIGLIANELVTNSIKYAFPYDSSRPSGSIFVHFLGVDKGNVELTVSDDGIGLPDDFYLDEATSLGLKLVHSLVEQLRGTVTLGEPPGVTWIISCPIYQGAQGTDFADMSTHNS